MPLVTINQSVQEGLKKDGIIPDVIDDFTPNTLVQLKYPCGKEVSLGASLKPSETQAEPEIQIVPDGEDDATYTLVLTDPDAPSREDPKWSEFCHWIITDLKAPTPEAIAAASEEVATFVKKDQGKTIVKYMGPAPPPKTGKHRYVFLLFKNGAKSPTEGPKERKMWGNDTPRTGVKQWAEKNGLTPVGANYFFARNDVQ